MLIPFDVLEVHLEVLVTGMFLNYSLLTLFKKTLHVKATTNSQSCIYHKHSNSGRTRQVHQYTMVTAAE